MDYDEKESCVSLKMRESTNLDDETDGALSIATSNGDDVRSRVNVHGQQSIRGQLEDILIGDIEVIQWTC